MKNLLCRLGFHKPDERGFVVVKKQKGKHKWQRNYRICKRCGKLLELVSFRKDKDEI